MLNLSSDEMEALVEHREKLDAELEQLRENRMELEAEIEGKENALNEELHLLVQAHTGKDSIKALNKRELQTVIRVLGNMKDSAKKSERGRNRYSGSEVTENQRKKIYKLTQELGWDKPARVNGMCQKMFGVSAVEWLNYQQCSKLIEALKSMLKRQKEKEEQDEGLQANSDSQG